MLTINQPNCHFGGIHTEGGGSQKKNNIITHIIENSFTSTISNTLVFRKKKGVLSFCFLNLLFLNSLIAQLDKTIAHVYTDTAASQIDVLAPLDNDTIQVTTLALRPLNELMELAIMNAPELKNNQVDYARQALAVKLQKRTWLDNMSISTASLYGNGTVVDASNNGTTTAYALSDKKSLNFNIGVGVRFSGGDILNRGTKVEAQRILLDRLQNERLIIESRIRETIINLYTQLEFVLKIVKMRADVVENQKLALAIADKYFQEGKYKPTDYVALLDKVTAAQEQYEQAKAEAKKLALLLKNIVNVSVWK